MIKENTEGLLENKFHPHYLTKGNVDDRNLKNMMDMTKDIFDKLYGDKGYICKAMADFLWGNGIQKFNLAA